VFDLEGQVDVLDENAILARTLATVQQRSIRMLTSDTMAGLRRADHAALSTCEAAFTTAAMRPMSRNCVMLMPSAFSSA
jgi:hypothetical protein